MFVLPNSRFLTSFSSQTCTQNKYIQLYKPFVQLSFKRTEEEFGNNAIANNCQQFLEYKTYCY